MMNLEARIQKPEFRSQNEKLQVRTPQYRTVENLTGVVNLDDRTMHTG